MSSTTSVIAHATRLAPLGRARPSTSIETCAPSRTTSRPATITPVTSPAVARERDAPSRSPARRRETRRSSPTSRGQPSHPPRRSTARRSTEELARPMRAAHSRRETGVELDAAGLLEDVDDRVRVGSDGEARSRIAQPAARSDAIGEVALGRRAEQTVEPPSSVDVRVGDVDRVDGGEAGTSSAPASWSSCVGVAPYASRHTPGSPQAARSRVRATARTALLPPHRTTSFMSVGATARTLWIAAATCTPSPATSASTRSAHACTLPSPNRSCTPSSGRPIPPSR